MISKDDWRLTDQEEYLMGAKLYYLKFSPYSAEWNHEHCEFCWATFSLHEDDEHEGYCTTPDNGRDARWICRNCFHDFKEHFSWEVCDETIATNKGGPVEWPEENG